MLFEIIKYILSRLRIIRTAREEHKDAHVKFKSIKIQRLHYTNKCVNVEALVEETVQ